MKSRPKFLNYPNKLCQHIKLKKILQPFEKELDQLYGPTWHVIVGKSFGSYVTHEQGYFVYFYIGDMAFLIFRSG